MEYDKSKVYTALNADELKVGSKVILADDLADLRNRVETDSEAKILSSINPETSQCRFCEGITGYALAYLVEEPEGLKWTDLKVGDVIMSPNNMIKHMVTGIDKRDTECCHIWANGWLTDDVLKEWKKVEND